MTDRKGQVSAVTYDALVRVASRRFGANANKPTAYTSSIAYFRDAGDRLTGIVDSTSGAITRRYDALDRMIEEATPQGYGVLHL